MANDINETLPDFSNKDFKLKGVFEILDKIEVPETPPWRDGSDVPTTSKMLTDIANNLINRFRNTQDYQRKLYDLKVKFVLNSNCGENEGTQTMDSTVSALNKRDGERISSEEQVSKNLLDAINHLESRNSGADRGLLDVEECIQDTHKVLMKNLLKSNKVGEFSTEKKMAGDGHVYPDLDTKEHAYNEVQTIVDRYNATIDYIKNARLDPIKQNSMYIRCAAWILYNFVALHPFADGNGRMCRLLASHCLYLVFPFPCPIYNIYAPTERHDYLAAIKKASCHNGKNLGDLVALLIESGWHTAKNLHDSK